MQNPQAIFFDLDETLVENVIPIPELFASVYGEFQNELGEANRELFFNALRPNIAGLWNSMFLQELSPEDQLTDTFTESIQAIKQHSSAQAEQLGERMFEYFTERSSSNVQLHEGATETLQALRNAGYITGIITNGIERLQLGKIHRLALQNEVDHVIVSAQARAHKPDAKVFNLALQRAGVAANTAWQIGDHATNDVAGAIRVGMSGVFYDPDAKRRESAFDELEVKPTHVVSNLSEILDILA